MPPRKRKEDIIPLVNEAQETVMPTDEVQVREHEEDEHYEIDYRDYYQRRFERVD